MGETLEGVIVDQSTDSAMVLLDTITRRRVVSVSSGVTGCLSVLGVLAADEEISIEIPTVVNPDEATDSHWTALMQDGIAVTLTSTHNVEAIPVGLLIRIKKPVTTHLVGIRWT